MANKVTSSVSDGIAERTVLTYSKNANPSDHAEKMDESSKEMSELGLVATTAAHAVYTDAYGNLCRETIVLWRTPLIYAKIV